MFFGVCTVAWFAVFVVVFVLFILLLLVLDIFDPTTIVRSIFQFRVLNFFAYFMNTKCLIKVSKKKKSEVTNLCGFWCLYHQFGIYVYDIASQIEILCCVLFASIWNM